VSRRRRPPISVTLVRAGVPNLLGPAPFNPFPGSDDSHSPTQMWGWGDGTMRVLEVRGRRDVDQDVARVLETGR